MLTQYFKISRKGPATLKSESHCDYGHILGLPLLPKILENFIHGEIMQEQDCSPVFAKTTKTKGCSSTLFSLTVLCRPAFCLSLVPSDHLQQLISQLISSQLASKYSLSLSSSPQTLVIFIVCQICRACKHCTVIGRALQVTDFLACLPNQKGIQMLEPYLVFFLSQLEHRKTCFNLAFRLFF